VIVIFWGETLVVAIARRGAWFANALVSAASVGKVHSEVIQ